MMKFLEWLVSWFWKTDDGMDPSPSPNPKPIPVDPRKDFSITKAAFMFPKQPGDGARSDTLVAFSEETNDAQFQRSLDYMKGIKANAYIVVLVNPDQATHKRTPYRNRWGGEFDQEKLNRWEMRTSKIVGSGMTPIFLMFSSLSKEVAKRQAEHERCIVELIGRFDRYVSMWGVGLEVSEFWTPDEVGDISKIFKAHTSKPVGVHSQDVMSGKSPNLSWFAYEFWNPAEGDKRSKEECVAKINAAKAKLGKSIIAGEYNINSAGARAREQGQACLNAGAVGAWNGW